MQDHAARREMLDLLEIQQSARLVMLIEESGIMALTYYALGNKLMSSAFAPFKFYVPIAQGVFSFYTLFEVTYYQALVFILRHQNKCKHYMMANPIRSAVLALAIAWFWAVALMNTNTDAWVSVSVTFGVLSVAVPITGIVTVYMLFKS